MKSNALKIAHRFLNSYFFHQILFCMLYFFLILMDDFLDGDFTKGQLIRDAILFVSGLLLVEFNIFVLVNKLLERNKTGLYFFSIIVSISIYSAIFAFIALHLFKDELNTEGSKAVFSYILVQYFVLVIISMFYHYNYKFNKVNQENYRLQAIQKEQKEAELITLKSQLNPHFLFNTLNNIYSYNVLKKPNASDLILKLSELTSYVLYDSEKEAVSLRDEIEFIGNFIELAKIRMDEKVRIDFDIHECDTNLQIAPLLFIPLIENVFKHGLHDQSTSDYAYIGLKTKENMLVFTTENTYTPNPDPKNKHPGIGIKNLKKRLKLIYPDSKIEILENGNLFKVMMNINLSG